MSIIPREAPLGAIRYNTDSNKMECFNGTEWMRVNVSSPDLNGGCRGLCCPGDSNGGGTINYITIPTTGDAVDFGDTSKSYYEAFGFASKTRFVLGGGNNGSGGSGVVIIAYPT